MEALMTTRQCECGCGGVPRQRHGQVLPSDEVAREELRRIVVRLQLHKSRLQDAWNRAITELMIEEFQESTREED